MSRKEISLAIVGPLIGLVIAWVWVTLGAGQNAADKALIRAVIAEENLTDSGLTIKQTLTSINERTIRMETNIDVLIREAKAGAEE